jgi:hypothetical protein
MPEIDKQASAAWRSRLREVLNRDWDPIGGCAEDEYDQYIGKIAAMLHDNASDADFVEYLKWAEVGNMGLGPASRFDRSHALKVIAALRAVGPPP